MKNSDRQYWKIIADEIVKAGYTYGVSREMVGNSLHYVVDARNGDGHRFVVHSDTKLGAFLALQKSLSTHDA